MESAWMSWFPAGLGSVGAMWTGALVVSTLGVVAGALSTVAGMGGGVFLVALLSFAIGPHAALATTAPALLVGNVHRLARFHPSLDRKLLGTFAIGAIPGAVIGGMFAAGLSPLFLSSLLVFVTLLAIARTYEVVTLDPPAAMWIPVAFVAGAIAATSGAGVIVAPLLVAGGIRGEALIATSAAVAIVLHLGRIVGYSAFGAMDHAELGVSVVLATFLVVGNRAGAELRTRMGEAGCDRATKVTLFVSLGLAVSSIARAWWAR